MLYELLTGHRPFSGADMGETLQRIINAQPEALARFNYDVPPELERILRKLLEKDVARRFQNPTDLLIDLRSLRRELGSQGGAAAAPPPPATIVLSLDDFAAPTGPPKPLMAGVVPEGNWTLLNKQVTQAKTLLRQMRETVADIGDARTIGRAKQAQGKQARLPWAQARKELDLS